MLHDIDSEFRLKAYINILVSRRCGLDKPVYVICIDVMCGSSIRFGFRIFVVLIGIEMVKKKWDKLH